MNYEAFNKPQVVDFLTQSDLLHAFDPDKIVEVFPCYHRHRVVFRYLSEAQHDRVIKIRPDNLHAKEEIRKLQFLLSLYHTQGVRVPRLETTTNSSSSIISMPYLGIDLSQIAQTADLIELNYLTPSPGLISGFSIAHIDQLIKRLKHSHLKFAQERQIIHGDLFQHNAPNNIVYHSSTNQLLLVDAEALGTVDQETEGRFLEQISLVEAWMHQYLRL